MRGHGCTRHPIADLIWSAEAGRCAVAPAGWRASGPAGWHRVLDRIDAGLVSGAIHIRLPDGTQRLLGGRRRGFDAEVDIQRLARRCCGSPPAVRSGWYQAWEAGEWDSPDPVPLFALFMANAGQSGRRRRGRADRGAGWPGRSTGCTATPAPERERNIHAHYDLGNDFYAAWLDPATGLFQRAVRWRRADRSPAAQQRKLDTIAERVAGRADRCSRSAAAGARWRSGCATAAWRSPRSACPTQQLAWAREHQRGRQSTFAIRTTATLTGHSMPSSASRWSRRSGSEYWPDFFDCLARCLKPGGRAAIQYIAIRDDLFQAYAASADFIQTYIFPGGMLVSEAEFRGWPRSAGSNGAIRSISGSTMPKRCGSGARTSTARWPKAACQPGSTQRFVRLWRFYLMYCEGGFRGGGIDVAQVTLVKRLSEAPPGSADRSARLGVGHGG